MSDLVVTVNEHNEDEQGNILVQVRKGGRLDHPLTGRKANTRTH